MPNPSEMPPKPTPEELRQMAEEAILEPRFQGELKILYRTLAWWLVNGDEEQHMKANRVLETCSDPREFLLLTLDQAIAQDSGDLFASDPRSFTATKNYGDRTSQGGSGPKPKE